MNWTQEELDILESSFGNALLPGRSQKACTSRYDRLCKERSAAANKSHTSNTPKQITATNKSSLSSENIPYPWYTKATTFTTNHNKTQSHPHEYALGDQNESKNTNRTVPQSACNVPPPLEPAPKIQPIKGYKCAPPEYTLGRTIKGYKLPRTRLPTQPRKERKTKKIRFN
eukprot:1024209_1